MKIGIVSDSHNKRKRLAKAVAVLDREGVETIVHCGDVGGTKCVRALAAAGVPVYLIAGNMDRHPEQLAEAARQAGVAFSWEVIQVPLEGGKRLVAVHGYDESLLEELVASEQFAYVCHGHTHRVRDDRYGPVRVISPGALAHSKNPHHPTVAVLDTGSDTLRCVDVPR